MSFTFVDGAILAVLALSGVLAFSRGLTREVMAIAGWLLAAFAAIYAAPLIEPLLAEIPGLGGVLAGSCSLGKLAAFSVGFAIALIVISFFTPLLSSAVQGSPLAPIDKGLGFLFGIARGVALVAVVYLVYDQVVPPADRMPVVDDAASVRMIADAAAMIQAALPDGAPDWLLRPVNDLMEECGGIPALNAPSTPVPDRDT